jgi:hypothetical protein
MENETGYLDRLPYLTPVDEPAIPSGSRKDTQRAANS